MGHRNLGNSGLKVTALGLGGNTFGSTADSEESIAVIHRAVEKNVKAVDWILSPAEREEVQQLVNYPS